MPICVLVGHSTRQTQSITSLGVEYLHLFKSRPSVTYSDGDGAIR